MADPVCASVCTHVASGQTLRVPRHGMTGTGSVEPEWIKPPSRFDEGPRAGRQASRAPGVFLTSACKGSSRHSRFAGAGWGWWPSEPPPSSSSGRWCPGPIWAPPCCCSEWVFSLCYWSAGGCLSRSEQKICQFGIPEREGRKRARWVHFLCALLSLVKFQYSSPAPRPHIPPC